MNHRSYQKKNSEYPHIDKQSETCQKIAHKFT
jgi:hypothetical protein